jgi:hypothetical protein
VAQVNPTAAFSGQYQEDFEGIMSFASGYVANPVIQGQANYYTNGAIQSTNWSFDCTITPHGGTRFIGDLGGGLMWLEFNTAASKFGGYFGSNQPGIALTVNVLFFDASNVLVGSDVVTLQNNCTWQWLGWEFPSTNVSKIEFNSSPSPGFLMMDDFELDSGPTACAGAGIGTAFCFGDGSGGPCPCGNSAVVGSGTGCANTNSIGAELCMTGSSSIAANNAVLIATDTIPNWWCLFLQADNVLGGGNGVPFANGRLCIGGNYAGIQFAKSDALGVVRTTVDIATMGGCFAGDVKRYQAYYHLLHTSNSPCGPDWNLTNGLEVAWSP